MGVHIRFLAENVFQWFLQLTWWDFNTWRLGKLTLQIQFQSNCQQGNVHWTRMHHGNDVFWKLLKQQHFYCDGF